MTCYSRRKVISNTTIILLFFALQTKNMCATCIHLASKYQLILNNETKKTCYMQILAHLLMHGLHYCWFSKTFFHRLCGIMMYYLFTRCWISAPVTWLTHDRCENVIWLRMSIIGHHKLCQKLDIVAIPESPVEVNNLLMPLEPLYYHCRFYVPDKKYIFGSRTVFVWFHWTMYRITMNVAKSYLGGKP